MARFGSQEWFCNSSGLFHWYRIQEKGRHTKYRVNWDKSAGVSRVNVVETLTFCERRKKGEVTVS